MEDVIHDIKVIEEDIENVEQNMRRWIVMLYTMLLLQQ